MRAALLAGDGPLLTADVLAIAFARRTLLRGLPLRTCDYRRAWRALDQLRLADPYESLHRHAQTRLPFRTTQERSPNFWGRRHIFEHPGEVIHRTGMAAIGGI